MKFKKSKTRPVEVGTDDSESRVLFQELFDDVSSRLIDRDEALQAISLALLSGQHILFEGKHGLAKSEIADAVFGRISGAEIFNKLLMKNTQPDEIFGPVNSERYRKEAVWEHNIARMLPSAHFAFLDEIYRASDSLLPSILGILNERRFHNGPVEVKCPLMTAIGATNYVTQRPDLEAFHDRWLFQLDVRPLAESGSRLSMFKAFLARNALSVPKRSLHLDDIVALRDRVRRIDISDETLSLYEELISSFKEKTEKTYISDRRLCQALLVAKAQAYLTDEEADEVTEDSLGATGLVLVQLGKDREVNKAIFSDVFQSVVGNAHKRRKELSEFGLLSRAVTKWTNEFDEDMPPKRAKRLISEITPILDTFASLPHENMPTLPESIKLLEDSVTSLTSLRASLEEVASKK